MTRNPVCLGARQVPLDNYVSRGTERFLTSTTPDYKASLFSMVQKALTGDYGG